MEAPSQADGKFCIEECNKVEKLAMTKKRSSTFSG
jgi:hypothetical protein